MLWIILRIIVSKRWVLVKKILLILVFILFLSCGYAEEVVDKKYGVSINGYSYSQEEMYPNVLIENEDLFIYSDGGVFDTMGYTVSGSTLIDKGYYEAFNYGNEFEPLEGEVLLTNGAVYYDNESIPVEIIKYGNNDYIKASKEFLDSIGYNYYYDGNKFTLNRKNTGDFRYNYRKVIGDINDYLNRNFKKILNENEIVYGSGYEYIYGIDEVGKEFIYLKYDDGFSYIGNREDDEFNGLGRIEYDDGSGYIGEFKSSEFHGLGQYRYNYDDYLPISFYENGKRKYVEDYDLAYSGIDGEQETLVILVEFQDQKLSFSEDEWKEYFFVGGKSIKGYLEKLSDKKMTIVPGMENNGLENDGILKVTMSFNHPDTKDDLSNEMAKVVGEVLKSQDEYVDFSKYDKNNDGIVSTFELKVISVIAGYEYNKNFMKGPSIYAHKNSFYSSPVRVDGVNIDGFLTVGEKDIRENMVSKGIVLHELFHLNGLLDLYDRDYSSNGLGVHSLMASGALISDQRGNYYFVGLDPWSKYKLGIVEPQSVERSGKYRIYEGRDNNYNVLKIDVGNGQYLLLENRVFTGPNKILSQFLTKSGIGIFKVNNNILVENFIENSVNDDENNFGVELVEANRLRLGYSQLKKGGNITLASHYFNEDMSEFNTKDYLGEGYKDVTIRFNSKEDYYELDIEIK